VIIASDDHACAETTLSLSTKSTGRYVMVQLSAPGYLSLAEVAVH
jgi:hypothetical protein